MANTPNYNFNISTGNDLVNPLTQIFPNFELLDTILRGVEDKTIGVATELKTGTVHGITRSDTGASMFRFQATGNFETNDTFTVDGLQVSALDVSGQSLSNGAFVIGSMVLCELRDNLLTVYVSGSADAQTLEGHPASYFGTKTEVDAVDDKADANNLLIQALTQKVEELGEMELIGHSGSTQEIPFASMANYRKIGLCLCNSALTYVCEINWVGKNWLTDAVGRQIYSSYRNEYVEGTTTATGLEVHSPSSSSYHWALFGEK